MRTNRRSIRREVDTPVGLSDRHQCLGDNVLRVNNGAVSLMDPGDSGSCPPPMPQGSALPLLGCYLQ